jgi:hypothetical protein
VAYTPDWELLAGALRRVMAAGLGEDEAKLSLSGAMADGKIRVRVRVAASYRARGGQIFYGGKGNGNVHPPMHLTQSDFDWARSCPLAPWPIGPRWGERREPEWIRGRENWPIDLLELSTADVTNVLCERANKLVPPLTTTAAQANAAIKALAANSRKTGPGAKTRGIEEAIDQLWPNRIPEGLSAKDRDNKIVAQLKINQSSVPKNIARAVQRVLAKRRTK